ncbi:carboxymuconolactone decarboxylase family protein [Fundidesulfovibrio soli]|uniref:carboxymuconolactone decarboxylase family protein n=1 Tax=Fundidesulfovibrio soli TaxID=2922716 RepID=UPI001FAF178E
MDQDRIGRGRELLARLNPDNDRLLRGLLDDLAPEMVEMIQGFFGDVYARPGLPLRERMIVTLAALAALGHAQPQLQAHVRNALNAGLTPEEITEIFVQISGYAGFPASLNALATAKGVFQQNKR